MKARVYVEVQRVYAFDTEVSYPEDALEEANGRAISNMELTTDDEENRQIFDVRDVDEVVCALDNGAVVCGDCGEELYRGQVQCACSGEEILDPSCPHVGATKDYGEGPMCLTCGTWL